MNNIKARVLLILLIGVSFFSYSQDSLNVLMKNSIKIKSIDPMNEDFSDLMPLVQRIGNARVVVLGEINHGDGSSFAFKSRMVKFLHQKMGFDVLAWEAGELDCWNLNNALRATTIPLPQAKQRLMNGGWDNEEQVQPVFEYAKSSWNSERPLEMMGFDNNRPPFGIRGFKAILNDIYTKLPDLKPTDEDRMAIDTLITINYGYVRNYKLDSILPLSIRSRAIVQLKKLCQKLTKPESDIENFMSKRQLLFYSFIIRMAIITWEHKEALYTQGNFEWNQLRDSAMSVSMNWQMDNLYPGRKIIVWAATSHFTRNSKLKKVIGYDHNNNRRYKQAGDYMYEKLGQNMFTIACASYRGVTGKIYNDFDDRRKSSFSYTDTVPKPMTGSYEYWAHASGEPYLFTDLRNAAFDDWLKKDFISGCTGFVPTLAPWYKLIDALFFIDEMYPVKGIMKGH